jgi:hypothetical protein
MSVSLIHQRFLERRAAGTLVVDNFSVSKHTEPAEVTLPLRPPIVLINASRQSSSYWLCGNVGTGGLRLF